MIYLKKDYRVDYIFTFGNKVSKKLSNFIKGSFFEIGSIRITNLLKRMKP